jgi:hypothetical protein
MSLQTRNVQYLLGTVLYVCTSTVHVTGFQLLKPVEEGTTRGTTALVYLQLHISLYTGTVHVLSGVAGVHPLI